MDVPAAPKARIGLEKQEHLVKLAILTTAAILCKLNLLLNCGKKRRKKSNEKEVDYLRLENL